jgi:hypothetical protein
VAAGATSRSRGSDPGLSPDLRRRPRRRLAARHP